MIICKECKSKDISEQVWVESNNLIDEGTHELYYAYDFRMENPRNYWCHICRDIVDVIAFGRKEK